MIIITHPARPPASRHPLDCSSLSPHYKDLRPVSVCFLSGSPTLSMILNGDPIKKGAPMSTLDRKRQKEEPVRLIHRPPFPVFVRFFVIFSCMCVQCENRKGERHRGGNHQNLVRFTDRYLRRPAVRECGYMPSHSIGHDAEVISQSASTGVLPVYCFFAQKKVSVCSTFQFTNS
jgi:hypothetical protein